MVIRAMLFCLVLAISLTGLSRAADAPLDLKQSSLKFTGHAFLHDFDGTAKDFQGSAQIDPAKPTLIRSAKIDFPTAGMTTFEDTRDRNMRDWLHVGTHPEIEFQLTTVLPLKGDPARATRDNPVQFTVRGTLTLNGTPGPWKPRLRAGGKATRLSSREPPASTRLRMACPSSSSSS